MKKIYAVIILLLFYFPVQAQELTGNQLDSLYNLFVRIRVPSTEQRMGIQSIDTTHIKCGFGIISTIKNNYNRFSQKQKSILKVLLDRPITDTSFVTPNGFFRVHYNISGPDVPKYNLDSLAIALDSAYNFEVNYLGYPPPPSDNGAGGDDKYDIYIVNLGNTYGQTMPETETPTGSGHFTSFMEINNDYTGFYTQGINAARVTVAHEFHHAIQVGDYVYRYDLDGFFYELTSTSMEHFVYKSIPDYYDYLPSYFNDPQNCFGKNGSLQEYALAIWNIFLQENFGYDIIKKQWQLMPQMRALQAISNSFIDYQTSFGEQLNKFGIWTYFTSYRSISGKYFEDGIHYPVVQPITTINFNPPSKSLQLNTSPVSNSFIQFINPLNLDTLAILVTNADVGKGIDSVDAFVPFNYSLFNSPQNGSIKLTSDYYENFNADKPAFWLTAAMLNNQVIEQGNYITENIDYAFPSPFTYTKNAYVYIPAKPDEFGYVDINIYTSGMRLVYSSHQRVNYIYGQKVVRWDGLDIQNNKLASGVYIFVVKSGDNITKGKLVIFNE